MVEAATHSRQTGEMTAQRDSLVNETSTPIEIYPGKETPTGLRRYDSETLDPDTSLAIELFDEIPDLSDSDKESLFTYFLWHGDNARFRKIGEVMGVTDPHQIHDLTDRVMESDALVEDYEEIELAISTATEILNAGLGKASLRRRRQYVHAVRKLQNEADANLTEDEIIAQTQRIQYDAEDSLYDEIKKEAAEMTEEEKLEFAIALLKDKIDVNLVSGSLKLNRDLVLTMKQDITPPKPKKSTSEERPTQKRGYVNQAVKELLDNYIASHGMEPILLADLIKESDLNYQSALTAYNSISHERQVPALKRANKPRPKTMSDEKKGEILNALDILSPRQRIMVTKAWGLGCTVASPGEIGIELGLKPSSVKTLIGNAKTKLRTSGVDI